MEPDEPLSETLATITLAWLRWVPLVLLTLFVAALAATHALTSTKVKPGLKVFPSVDESLQHAYAVWAWLDANILIRWGYGVLVIGAGVYLAKGRHKLWVVSGLVVLLAGGLWYWDTALWLSGKFLALSHR
jgi:hypothetical protein